MVIASFGEVESVDGLGGEAEERPRASTCIVREEEPWDLRREIQGFCCLPPRSADASESGKVRDVGDLSGDEVKKIYWE